MSENEDYWKTIVHPDPLLRLARQQIQGLHDDVFKGRDLKTFQIQILKCLYVCGDLSKAMICERIKIKAANINAPMKSLFDRGYIFEKVDENDARKRIVGLTETGRAEFESLRPLGKKVADEFMSPLREAEKAMFFDMLIRLCRVDQEGDLGEE